jgi:hypothetical protein
MDRGIISDPVDSLELLGWPDTDKYVKGRTAARRVIERNIEAMLNGRYVSPEETDDHALAARLVTEAYHRARLDGVGAKEQSLLLTYLAQTKRMMEGAKQQPAGQEEPAPAPAAAAVPPTPAPPGAPPEGA